MVKPVISFLIMLGAITMVGCLAPSIFTGDKQRSGAAQGMLIPPPAGAQATVGWSIGVGGNEIYKSVDVSAVHDAAVALQGKMVDAVLDPPPVGTIDPTTFLRSVTKARLKGIVHRAPIDARHPTGWTFTTKMAWTTLTLPLEPNGLLATIEQLDGKNAVVTGAMQGMARTGVRLVPDTLEPQ